MNYFIKFDIETKDAIFTDTNVRNIWSERTKTYHYDIVLSVGYLPSTNLISPNEIAKFNIPINAGETIHIINDYYGINKNKDYYTEIVCRYLYENSEDIDLAIKFSCWENKINERKIFYNRNANS